MATYCSSSPRKQTPSVAADGRSKIRDDEDLLLEVLIRLPDPRSAWRCKAICKRWNSLISTSYFSRRFVSHHQSLTAGEPEPPPLFPSKIRERISTFLPLPAPLDFRIYDCFKDLLLLGVEIPGQYSFDSERCRTYVICNPFTKQWVALPLAPERPEMGEFMARLVCKPSTSSIALELGDNGENEEVSSSYHLGYRFRVVHMPCYCKDSQVDVFCSESGEWTKVVRDVLVGDHAWWYYAMVPVNGELYSDDEMGDVDRWDPFRLDGTPKISEFEEGAYIHASQGALYKILPEKEEGEEAVIYGESSYDALSVWKLEKEKGCSSEFIWRRHYEVSLKKLSCEMRNGREIKGSEMGGLVIVGQDQENPEIVFLDATHPPDWDEDVIFSCDLKREQLVVYPDQRALERESGMFQPRVNLWPTRIPNYEKLRGMYDGSYPCFVQGKPMEELLLDGLQLS